MEVWWSIPEFDYGLVVGFLPWDPLSFIVYDNVLFIMQEKKGVPSSPKIGNAKLAVMMRCVIM